MDCKLCLKDFRLGMFTGIGMLLIFEKGIRGGISQPVKRYSKASNKHIKDLYNPGEESICLQYLDANNLYGWATTQKLTAHGFSWKEAEDITPEK